MPNFIINPIQHIQIKFVRYNVPCRTNFFSMLIMNHLCVVCAIGCVMATFLEPKTLLKFIM